MPLKLQIISRRKYTTKEKSFTRQGHPVHFNLLFSTEFMAFMMSARGDTTLNYGRRSQTVSTVFL